MPASKSWNVSARAVALAHYAARGKMLPASAQRHSWGYIEPFEVARHIARGIDPSANLDYIPVKDQGLCQWIDDKILHNPSRGDLMWVGDARRPTTAYALRSTKLFVCRQCVSSDIQDVVLKSKERWQHRYGMQWTSDGCWYIDNDEVQRWMGEAREEWRREVGESWYRCLDKKDWAEAYDKMLGGLLDRGSFMDWMDQQAWDRGMEDDGSWGTPPSDAEHGGEADMEESGEEEAVPASSSGSVYELDLG